MNGFDLKISIRIYGIDIDSVKIKKEFESCIKGRVIAAKKKYFCYLVYDQYCEVGAFQIAIEKIISDYNKVRSSVSGYVTNLRAELFLGVFINENSGIVLESNIINKLSENGLGVSFDIYPPDKEDNEGLKTNLEQN